MFSNKILFFFILSFLLNLGFSIYYSSEIITLNKRFNQNLDKFQQLQIDCQNLEISHYGH